MHLHLCPACLVAPLLASAVLARAGVSYDESPTFAFDTRESNSTHYALSGAFVFNTLAFDGLSGSRPSGTFSFDTRSESMTGLTAAAPPNASGGAAITLNAIATFSSGVPEDVSNRATWSVTGGRPIRR